MPDVEGAVQALAAALDAIGDLDPSLLADGDAVVALHRHLARLEAIATRSTAAFDADRTWETDGARSAAAWIGVRCHVPTSAARRRVRLGRELRHMPAV